MIVGIQNNVFKHMKSHWKFNEEEMAHIHKPNSWMHVVAVIYQYFYHCDYRDGELSKYTITYMMETHKDRKYMLRVEKVYEINLKHQEK